MGKRKKKQSTVCVLGGLCGTRAGRISLTDVTLYNEWYKLHPFRFHSNRINTEIITILMFSIENDRSPLLFFFFWYLGSKIDQLQF